MMAATDRQILDLIRSSDCYNALNQTDRTKVAKALAGLPSKRPASALGQAAWYLAQRLAPVQTIPAPFNGNGLVLLEPTGGTEDIQAAKNAGFTYLLLNLNYVSGGNWDLQRQRAASLGVAVVPWARVHTAADSQGVEATAIAWGSPAVAHNLESEAVTTYSPSQLANAVAAFPPKPRAVITEPWVQNGAGWSALSSWVAMPEAYQNANPAFTPSVVVAHARAEGMPLAVPMFGWGQWSDAGTYIPPATYLAGWSGPFAVYNGDSKEPQYGEWKR